MRTLCIILIFMACNTHAEDLKPKQLKPGATLYQNDFSKETELDKTRWQMRQGTRWSIEDGSLKGTPSSPEYQAKKKASGKGHLGTTPRIYMLDVPKNFILSYRFKFEGGTSTRLIPLVEFGHHETRVYFSPEGPRLLIDHEKTILQQINKAPIENDRWYTVLTEVQGDTVIVQIEGIGTLQGTDPFIEKSERPIIGITGKVNGILYLDDIHLMAVAEQK